MVDEKSTRFDWVDDPEVRAEAEALQRKLERGELPRNDPLVRLHEAILGLRSLIKS